jgi:hypothetical protein
MTRPAITLVLLPGMDGTGELFADFVTAVGDAAVPLVVRYPGHQPLDYEGITAFAGALLPQDRPYAGSMGRTSCCRPVPTLEPRP